MKSRKLILVVLVLVLALLSSHPVLGAACINETGVCNATIQGAIENATAGQTVVITDDSVYNENITITSGKTGLTLTSNGTGLPLIVDPNVKTITIDADDVTINRVNVTLLNGSSNDAAIEIANQLNITIQNVYILVNSSVSNNYGVYGLSNSDNNTVRNATITVQDGTAGIYFETSSNITIENSVIVHQDSAGGQGIRFGGGNEIGLRVHGTRIESTSGGATVGISVNSALELKHSNITVDGSHGIQSTGSVLLDYMLIENSTINYTGASFTIYAVGVEGTNITIRDSVLSATQRALAFDHPSQDVNVYDTIINGNNPLRINYNGNPDDIIVNVTLTNTTVSPGENVFTSCTGSNTSCNITYRNHLDVYVNSSSGAISGASVTVDNSTDSQVFSGSTDGSGNIERQNITYARENSSFMWWVTNHTVNASHSSYVSNSTIVNMSSYQFVKFTLTALPPSVDSVILNATSANNFTSDNLTVYPVNTLNDNTLIHNWVVDNVSIALINMPFDTNIDTLGNDVKDYSGLNNNGTLGDGTAGNAPVWNSSGISGGTYTFDGNNDYIAFPGFAGFGALTNRSDFTISLWMKTELNTTRQAVFSDADGSANHSVLVGFGGNGQNQSHITTSLGLTTGAYVYLDSDVEYYADNWYHVVVTFDSTTLQRIIYINGTKQNNDTLASGYHDGVNLVLGRAGDCSCWELNGSVDELQIYNRVLSPEQIATMYNNGSPRYNLTTSEETSAGQNWSVVVTPNDGTQDGTSVTSNWLIINKDPVCINETSICWPTIQEAIDNATTGQTIVITDSRSYAENITIAKDDLVLTSNGTSIPTINASNVTAVYLNSDNNTISRLKIYLRSLDQASATHGIEADTSAQNLLIEDLIIDINATNATSDGINWRDGRNATIQNLTILMRVGDDGFDDTTLAGTTFVLINNSIFNGSDTDSTRAINGAVNYEIYGTTFYDWGFTRVITMSDGLRMKDVVIQSSKIGLLAGSSDNYYLENVTINSTSDYGLRGGGANWTVNNSWISGSPDSIRAEYNASSYTVVDTVLVDGVRVGGNQGVGDQINVTLIGTNITPDETIFVSCFDDNCSIHIFSYLDVLVNDTSGPVNGASVTVDDVNSNQVFSGSTDGSGRIIRQTILFANESSADNITFRSNHSVNVSASGYTGAGQSTNMTTNRFLTFTLTPLSTVCINETSVCWPTIQEAYDNATAGQTIVITDDRVYEENITVDQDLILTSNGTGIPTIYGNNITAVTVDGVIARFQRLNVNATGDGSTIRAIYIESANVEVNITDVEVWANLTGSTSTAIRMTGASNGITRIDRTNVTTYNITDVYSVRIESPGNSVAVVNNSNIFSFVESALRIDTQNGTIENTLLNASFVGLDFNDGDAVNVVKNLTVYSVSIALDIRGQSTIEDSFFNSTSGRAATISGNFNMRRNEFIGGTSSSCVSTPTNRGAIGTISDSSISGCLNTLGLQTSNDHLVYNITLINVTGVDPSTTDIDSDCVTNTNVSCNATYISYLDVYVNDSSSPIVGASVTVDNSSGGQVFSGSTNSSGNIVRQNITYALINGSDVTTWITNHTVNVTSSGHVGAGNVTNMSQYRFVKFTLSQIATVCINETGVCWFNVTDAVANATTGQTIVITDSSTYSESVTIDKTLTITSNSSTRPTIAGPSNHVFELDANLTLSKINITASSNAEVLDYNGVYKANISESSIYIDIASVDSFYDGGFSDIEIYMDSVSMRIRDVASNVFDMPNSIITITNSNFSNVDASGFTRLFNANSAGRKYFENVSVNFTNSLSRTFDVDDAIFNNVTIVMTGAGVGIDMAGNVTILDSTLNTSDDALTFSGSGQHLIKRTRIESDEASASRGAITHDANVASLNVSIADSSFSGSFTDPIFISQSSGSGNQVTFKIINTTGISPGDAGYGSCSNDNCEILFQNYLDVYVNSSSGALSGATVDVYDVNETSVVSTTTDVAGNIFRQNITYIYENNTGSTLIVWITNHTVNVSASGYTSNGSVINMSSSQFVKFTLSATVANCGETSNVTNCVGQDCLEYHNLTGTRLVVFDENGSIDITSSFTTGSVQSNAEFVIRNSTNNVVASINSTGYMNILGTVTDEQGFGCTEPNEGFIVRNGTGTCVAYIDNSGNLWAKEDVCYNSNIQ